MTKVADIVHITDQIANVKSGKQSSDYKGIIALGNGLSPTLILPHEVLQAILLTEHLLICPIPSLPHLLGPDISLGNPSIVVNDTVMGSSLICWIGLPFRLKWDNFIMTKSKYPVMEDTTG